MTKELSKLEQQIQKFMPFNEQEEHDKAILLKWFESGSDILTRENEIAHLTASAWVVSPDKKSVLMAYHNIYLSGIHSLHTVIRYLLLLFVQNAHQLLYRQIGRASCRERVFPLV